MDISTQDTQISTQNSTQVSTQERVVKHITGFRSARIKHESTGCGPDIPCLTLGVSLSELEIE